MRVKLSTELDISAGHAWAEVKRPRLMTHVARPLVTIEPVEPPMLPDEWRPGRYLVRMRLLGVLPIGEQWIVITELSDGPVRYGFRDEGHGRLAARWDHRGTIEPIGPTRCRYRDEVDVGSGPLGSFVWSFARLLFAHRQRRLRALARNGFRY